MEGYDWSSLTVAAVMMPIDQHGVRAETPIVRAPDGKTFKPCDQGKARPVAETLIGETEFGSGLADGLFLAVPETRAYRHHVAAVATSGFVEAITDVEVRSMRSLPWLALPHGMAWTYVTDREWEGWTSTTALRILAWAERTLIVHLRDRAEIEPDRVLDLLAHARFLLPTGVVPHQWHAKLLGVLFLIKGDTGRLAIVGERETMSRPDAVPGRFRDEVDRYCNSLATAS